MIEIEYNIGDVYDIVSLNDGTMSSYILQEIKDSILTFRNPKLGKFKIIAGGTKNYLILHGHYVKLDPIESYRVTVGSRWYYYDPEKNKYRLLEVTYIRSGAVFFIFLDEENPKEQYFANGSLMERMLEPEVFYVTSKYWGWIFRTRSGLTKFIYSDKVPKKYKNLSV